jgi:cytochrome c biogenesis protein CcmG, thiol:disulfide interchange protein DsbE
MDEDRRGILRAIGIGALVFMVVMAFGAPGFFGGQGMSSPLVGHPAPPFAAEITAGEGADAHDRIALDALRGNVVVLDFWASWCQPCRTSIPIVGRVAAAHRAAGLVTLGINVESDLPAARVIAAHRALEIPVPTIQDPGFRIQGAYDVASLPTLVIIDRSGVVRRVHTGVPEEQWLDEVVRELL